MVMFRVVWECKDGRHGGMGSPINEYSARAFAETANRNLPEIHHWVEQVVDEPELERKR